VHLVVTKLYQNVILSNRLMAAGVAVVTAGVGALIINWGMVRSEVSRESAEVISETLGDERINVRAREFSKELINHILSDREISDKVADWTIRLLHSIQDQIGALFVSILQQQQVVDAVTQLANQLVEYLCSSSHIQARVGQLLVDAINLQDTRNSAAQWAYDLVLREDVTEGFRDLVVAALQMESVVSTSQTLAVQVLNRVLQDPNVVLEAKRLLSDALRDGELRATAKESLWNIVMPWSTTRALSKDTQRALKSLEEIRVLDTLTQEERQMLQSLQARLRRAGGVTTVSSTTSVSSTTADTNAPDGEIGRAEVADREQDIPEATVASPPPGPLLEAVPAEPVPMPADAAVRPHEVEERRGDDGRGAVPAADESPAPPEEESIDNVVPMAPSTTPRAPEEPCRGGGPVTPAIPGPPEEEPP